MESVKDVQGRDVREGEAGLHGGGDEHPGSGAGVRAAPGHGEEDAKVFGAAGVLTAASATQA